MKNLRRRDFATILAARILCSAGHKPAYLRQSHGVSSDSASGATFSFDKNFSLSKASIRDSVIIGVLPASPVALLGSP